MDVRSRAVRRCVAAFAAALLVLPVAVATAVAADPIQLQARPLVAGRFEDGGWLGVAVSLSNDAQPVSGYVVAEGQDGPVQRAVELPAGARKQVTLFLRPGAFTRQVEIRFETDAGQRMAAAKADVKVLELSSATIALFGDAQGHLRSQMTARGIGAREPISLAVADLPERPEPLAGIETIAWAGDGSPLSEAQRRAVERWVASGGDLIVVGGADWQSRTAAFADLLPVSDLAAVDDAPVSAISAWAGIEPPQGLTTFATGTLVPDATALAVDDAGRPLVSVRNSGAGRVIFIGADLATAPFSEWDGATSFWSRLLPDDRLAQQLGAPSFVPQEQVDAQMSQALSNLPSLQVPPAELLLGVIVAYILLIGPASYLVLRRFDRRELAWVTAPVLVVAFSAGSYGIGASIKGSDVIVNEVNVMRTTSGASAASVSTFAGVFSPSRSTYDLTVRGDALISSLSNVFEGSPRPAEHVTEQGDPAHLRGLAVSVFGLQGVHAEAVIAYQPAMDVSWHYEKSTIAGTVTNTADAPLSDVAVLATGGAKLVGDLAPGASADFTVSISSLNGSLPSDRLYGFQSSQLHTTDRDLQVLTRRQVIDSLVAAGGGFPGKFGDVGGVSADLGPYVIGWRDDVDPIDVEIDGQKVQRFSQSVEVVEGRPALGPGDVTLGPSDLDVEVVATEGEVNSQDPLVTMLGNGSVDFRISLPLAAARLTPLAASIVVGSDPTALMFDQLNGTSLPPGYRVSVHDVVNDTWIDLGDPSVKGRFDVARPQDIIDTGNAIVVRITGDGVPLEQGQTPVIASATISGRIGR